MVVDHAAYLLAIAVGIVSSGLVASFWGILADEEPRFALLLDPNPGFVTPFRVLAIVFAAPTMVLLAALGWTIRQPLWGLPLLVLALGWSFIQGVFILTQVFGLG